jgi:hypothetical protein
VNEHRIVIVIDAVYRTDDPDRTRNHLMGQHYEITSKRAQAVPARHAWGLIDSSADEFITLMEANINAE